MIKNAALVALLGLSLLLTGCSFGPPPERFAATVCATQEEPDDLEDLVDVDWVRVPDTFCPIGDDGVPNQGNFWVYSTYTGRQVTVPLTGADIDQDSYVLERPREIVTLNLHRGLPETIQGAPGATQASVIGLGEQRRLSLLREPVPAPYAVPEASEESSHVAKPRKPTTKPTTRRSARSGRR